ncbi:MAG: mechanosensitive ion channel, partial [Campylobacterales bacterium]|nr:mechanosensitive ion channel [Campylobacterales bacterium]
IEYLFHNRLKDFKIQTKKLSIIRDEYNEAVYHIKEQLKSIDEKNSSQTYQLKKAIYYFEDAKELIANKEDVLKHQQKIYQKELKNYEKTQLQSHLINIGVIIFIFIIFESLKRFITNKIEDEERYFKVKKILNITFFLLMLMVFIIFNIDNIIYAATLIGFIAAAITISLKEYLQSFVAWFYLSFGNFIKTGDRILIHINNVDIIGEVINISPFKITLYESINNTTSVHLKRAGRIVFIPNNYFVTNYVYNYTHDKMKTIYDLVEFKIPFDEDIEKIEEIAYEVALSVSEKYMEVASKQFLRLKQRYDMRSRDFRPRIHLIPHQSDSCFTLYIWYVTPYHLVMELKSQLSQKIVQRFKDEKIQFYKTINK